MPTRIVTAGLIAGCLAACATTAPEDAGAAADLGGACDRPLAYAVDFDRLDETAQQISHATGCFIEVEDMADIADVEPNPVRGTMSPRQAVTTAIAGTPVRITAQSPDRIVLGRGG